MGFLAVTIFAIFGIAIGTVLYVQNTRRTGVLVFTIFSAIIFFANLYFYSISSATNYGKEIVHKQIEKEELIEKQNEIINRLKITPEELELLRAL